MPFGVGRWIEIVDQGGSQVRSVSSDLGRFHVLGLIFGSHSLAVAEADPSNLCFWSKVLSSSIQKDFTSSYTVEREASLRFDGALNVDITEFQTNLVPYPRTCRWIMREVP